MWSSTAKQPRWRTLAGVVAVLALAATQGCLPAAGNTVVGAAVHSGERIYRTRCSSCHELFPPHAYADGQWPAVLRRMQPDAGLSDEELTEVLEWLRSAN